jgi:predicted PurR-regulated permease PerM
MESTPSSPRWNTTTKLVAMLALVGIVIGLLVQFHTMIAPLLMSFMLAYLFHPLASFLKQKIHLPWSMAAGIIYITVAAILIGLLTWGGVGIIQQVQSLLRLLQTGLNDLPGLIEEVSQQRWQFGPFEWDWAELNIDTAALVSQIASIVQPVLGSMGDLLGRAAGSALATIGWLAFILLVSYFILAEGGELRSDMVRIRVPGYEEDVRRLGKKLERIWQAFLRGQMILFVLTIIVYWIVLGTMGVSYSLGIAILAGLARFVPYLGPTVTWMVLGLVTYFQTVTPLGLDPAWAVVVTVSVGLVIDQIFDYFLSPRIMADSLQVHPAAVMVAVLVSATWLGIIGVFIAAPMLASAILLGRYATRKIFDIDPWQVEENAEQDEFSFRKSMASLWQWLKDKLQKVHGKKKV